MATGQVGCTIDGGVATVVLDNPAKRNAMTTDMWNAIPPLLASLTADPDVRVVVVTGAGDAFSAGADISALTGLEPGVPSPAALAEDALVAFPKPIVAAIRGWCVGGGCQVSVAGDFRIAEEGARFGITPAKIGVVYPAATTARLVDLVGPAAAKFLLFTGDFIDAERALRIGLIDELVPAGALDARIAELTTTLVSRSQLTQHAAKDLVRAATIERQTYWEEAGRAELAEGVAAFVERREPTFPWRPA
ncbi:enoyl-CoA hydratase/isomerase family protein [Cryptosporangium phraense]|uniref:Enoyl-CoA hydratase/isomerase family protein n=1 Tax=Cryptosporangium phraense TaxID=2593070 RepID=A0A545AWM7_9ACTN|nr:enoyl-CoA hydratase/isomerase family protein [Cryptosporangium phraense]TQS45728.1 enoyl-CoA hydratase/isomerase family protein [Cryptosporangium phraense]